MTVEFKPARREGIPLLVGFEGASGSGKTHCALLFARGLCRAIAELKSRPAKMAIVDTENRRALFYADDFQFLHFDMHPPFSPEAHEEVLAQAEAAGIDVLIFDTFSHEWAGEGGVKEWADRLESGTPKPGVTNPRTQKDDWQNWWKDWSVKPMVSPGNWNEPKTAHKALVNKMLRSPCHIIVTLRSQAKMKMEQVEENGRKKTVITAPADMPLLERWVPECEKNFPYEISTSFLFVPDAPGVPIVRKRVTASGAPAVDEQRQMSDELGYRFGLWAGGAKAAGQAELTVDEARDLVVNAGSVGELERVWKRRDMAPWREQLQPLLNDRKADLSPKPEEQPTDERRQPEPESRGAADPGGIDYEGV